jgi:hypothetical protein
MMHSWIGERMGEEHRRDLGTPTRSAIRWDAEGPDPDLIPAASIELGHQPVRREAWNDDCMPRRTIAPSVGALLIRMGTRLGGASMRPS